MTQKRWLVLASLWSVLLSTVLALYAAAGSPATSVSGRVVRLDGQPAGGAWVRAQTTDNLTYADEDGYFTLDGLDEGITVTLTGWHPDHKVGWVQVVPPADPVTITVRPYDTRDNVAYAWNTSFADPANPTLGCGHCMVPAIDEWQITAHAVSGTNPRFFSLYNGTDISGTAVISPGYKLDFPGTAGNCATCHAPGAAYDAPFTTDMNELEGVDREGVFCEFCHKVGAVYLNPATGRPYDNAPGVLSMRLYRPYPDDQIFFGSLDDVTRRVSYLPLEKQSEFCAPCHQFSFWGTPIYQSFREWQESPYPAQGIQCQTCHDPPGDDPYFVLPEKGGLARNPARLASHQDLGLKDSAFMTGTVAVTLTSQTIGHTVAASVTLTNVGAGHHAPTDHPGRHMILIVTATDRQGQVLPQVGGPTVPAWGGPQAGLAGKVFAKVLRDAVTGEYPVVSYWKQAFIIEDNRLPAFGSDSSTYVFAGPATGGQVTVTAELYFRRTFQAEMDARGWDMPDLTMAVRQAQVSTKPWSRLFLPLVVRSASAR